MMTTSPEQGADALFAGMGVRAVGRAVDWGATPLGPVEGWPPGLRAAVRICFNSRAPMAIWAGPEFTLIHNAAYVSVLGAKYPAAMGRPLSAVWPELWQVFASDFRWVRDDCASIHHDEVHFSLRRNEHEEDVWFTDSLTPIQEEDGRVTGVLEVLEERTGGVRARREQEERLADSEERYRDLFERIEQGFAVVEALLDDAGRAVDYRFLETNPAFERQTDLRGAVGRTIRELVPDVEPFWSGLIGHVARTGEPRRGEHLAEAVGRWFDVHLYRVGDPEERRVAVLLSDITRRKRTELALQEADRRKDHFLAVLSHELRNPLTPVKNSLHILDRAPPDGEQARRAWEVIRRQIDQLCRLVDDLLDVTRIRRGKVQLKRRRLELNELVARTVEDHRAFLEQSGLLVRLSPAPARVLVDADGNRIAQVLSNLLQNAAKFTAPGGAVTIAVATDPSSREATVRVEDTGAGMAPETLSLLFQPFMQADETIERSSGGLGLGLALVKGLVEMHGGAVEAWSAGVGRGASFTVRLPVEAVEPSGAPRAQGAAASIGRRVLVIEDNVDAADSLRDLLAMEGHEVEVAYDGPSGVARAHALRPEIVLCDLGLPGMDGYAVARALRADEALRGAYLVALSGHALPEDVQRGAEAGFDRHLAKPPCIEELRSVLHHDGAQTPAAPP